MGDSGHRVDPHEAFRVIYKVLPNYPKRLGQRLLAKAEATALRLQRPFLCPQKNLTHAPRLPWRVNISTRIAFLRLHFNQDNTWTPMQTMLKEVGNPNFSFFTVSSQSYFVRRKPKLKYAEVDLSREILTKVLEYIFD
ncbi:hypothetical protein SprV_0200810900 [Sparganum proliferum]